MGTVKEDLSFNGSLPQMIYDLGELGELGALKIPNGVFFTDKILIEKLEANENSIFVSRKEINYKNINLKIKHGKGIEFNIYVNGIKIHLNWNEKNKDLLIDFYLKWLLFRRNNPSLYK